MSPAQGLQLMQELYQEIDAAACTTALRAAWTNEDFRILVCSNKEPVAAINDKLVHAFTRNRCWFRAPGS